MAVGLLFFTISGRTDLRISLCRAKFDDEADFEVRSPLAPPKPCQNCKKRIFVRVCKIFSKISESVETLADASKCIRTHPNGSEQVRIGQSESENCKKLAKTQKSRKNRRNFTKFSRTLVSFSFRFRFRFVLIALPGRLTCPKGHVEVICAFVV